MAYRCLRLHPTAWIVCIRAFISTSQGSSPVGIRGSWKKLFGMEEQHARMGHISPRGMIKKRSTAFTGLHGAASGSEQAMHDVSRWTLRYTTELTVLSPPLSLKKKMEIRGVKRCCSKIRSPSAMVIQIAHTA